MHYTQEKFTAFDNAKKLRVICSFIEAIATQWDDEQLRDSLIANFKQCLGCFDASPTEEFALYRSIADMLDTSLTAEEFLYVTKDIWHNHGKALLDSDLYASYDPRQQQVLSQPKLPLYIILDNLRSAFNVGSVIRTGECFGVEKFFFCGYTPTPDNSKVKKTAMKTDEFIIWEHHPNTPELLRQLKPERTIIALETVTGAMPLHQTAIPFPAALLIGNEALGVSKECLDIADITVRIPVRGWKNSFNVANALGIACYELFRQWTEQTPKK